MKLRQATLWFLLWIIASVMLSFSSFESSSNDSKFYSRLVGQLVEQPAAKWIAPKWGDNFWGHNPDKYVHDHFVGNILPAVALAKLGVPSQHALNILQMLLTILSIFLLVKICSYFIDEDKSLHLLWMLQIMPIAFTYGIRANHEQGMMFCMFVAVLGAVMWARQGRGLSLIALGSAGVLLVKGASVLVVPIMIGLVLILVAERKRLEKTLVGILLSLFSIVVFALAYNYYYEEVTGLQFLPEYWRVQVQERSLEAAGTSPFLIQKMSNFGYYLNRSVFYTAPWSLIALFVLFKNIKPIVTKLKQPWSDKTKLLLMLAGLGFIQIGAFSVSNRTASRYIFPVFYLFSCGFSVYVLHHFSGINKLTEKISRWGVFKVSAIMWFLFFCIHLGGFYLKN